MSRLRFNRGQAVEHLRAQCQRLGRVIDELGPLDLRVSAERELFSALSASIVYQQLSGKAAATIHSRFCALFKDDRPQAAACLEVGYDPLRGAGLSHNKALAVLDLFGAERRDRVEHVLAGDIVARKKPDPAVYLLAAERFALDPAECMVIEDSHIGLTAALGAGMNCIVTTSAYTADEDFDGALRVVPELGDPPLVRLDLADLRALCAVG